MKKLGAIVVAFGLVLAAGCNKPKEEDCRRAIDNIRKLSGTEKLLEGENTDAWVRRCRGASKRETVACAIAAQSLDELKKCNIVVEPPPENKSPFGAPRGSGSGSASGSSGSGSASGSPSGSGSASGT